MSATSGDPTARTKWCAGYGIAGGDEGEVGYTEGFGTGAFGSKTIITLMLSCAADKEWVEGEVVP